MAQTVSITDKGNGKYEIKDSDGQTRNVDFSAASKEASKTGIKITGSSSLPSPNQQTNGYSYIFGQNYPTGSVSSVPAGNVLINGKVTPVADAVTQAQGAKNLGLIRTNLIKYGQLTKAEARDPNNLLNKWATIVAGAANDPDPANRDPFKYAQSLQKQGFVSTYGATSQQIGTRSYPTITNPTDAEATINKVFQDRLNRLATPSEINQFTKLLNDAEAKNPTKVTYTASGQKTVGGINAQQFLSDEIDKNKSLAAEAQIFKTQAPDLTKRLADKKIYDDLVAKANNDPKALQQAMDTTAYGRGLKEYQAQLQNNALVKGYTNTPEELNAIAKDLYDRGVSLNSQEAADAVAKTGKYGVDAQGRYVGQAGTTFDKLASTAMANGLDLQKVFGSQLPQWIAAIDKGESIDTYQKLIRDVAKIGMPDNVKKLIDNGVDLTTIYQPYKNVMSQVLELNPNSIDLNDPTLRAAITAQGEVPLYDFERQLRKDSRWQYTTNAHQTVSDATQRVLQDFGFMG